MIAVAWGRVYRVAGPHLDGQRSPGADYPFGGEKRNYFVLVPVLETFDPTFDIFCSPRNLFVHIFLYAIRPTALGSKLNRTRRRITCILYDSSNV